MYLTLEYKNIMLTSPLLHSIYTHTTNIEHEPARVSDELTSPDSAWLGFRKGVEIRKTNVVRNLKVKFAEVKRMVTSGSA